MANNVEDNDKRIDKKTNQKPSIEDALKELTRAVHKKIPEKVSEIISAWQTLKLNSNNEESMRSLLLKTHTFTGTMGTYGFDLIAGCAKQIELLLQNKIGKPEEVLPIGELERLFEQLVLEADFVANKQSTQVNFMPSKGGTLNSPLIAKRNTGDKIIYLVDDDIDFLRSLEVQIINFGYKVKSFTSLNDFDKALIIKEPIAVVMDVMFGEKKNGGIEHIAKLNRDRSEPLTTIFITGGDDLHTRLDAVRANGNAYYTKPVLVEQLIDTLDDLTYQLEETPFRIVIVDDSIEQSEFTALILNEAGMHTKEVNGPLALLTVLAEYPADLILMDLYMPECSGLELSQVIRQIDTYVNIPIVFLSAEKDLGKKLSAMSLGGDDFLSKPVEPWHLVSAITSRVIRGRTIRKYAETDGLTGLLNHSKSKERLEMEISRAIREGSPLSFAMIDIDLFKHVNDTYGHPAGDRVLKSLANLLKQRLRDYDIIGRYGGEEFAIVLPNTDLEAAFIIMDKLRLAFSEINHYHENGNYNCQFSCGIASFPDFVNGNILCNEADKALYKAKESGRNKVVCIKNG